MLTQEEYDAKRRARYERLLSAADRIGAEGRAIWNQADRMATVIPFGQPVHGDADRRYRERIDRKHRRGYDLIKKAEALKDRADAAAKNRAIFSDDPSACEQIAAKVARLEARQAAMKQANALIKKNDREGLRAMGFSDLAIEKLFMQDFCGRIGFPDYSLTNNSANIRRLKKRAGIIEDHKDDQTSEKTVNGIRIVDNCEDSRLQVFFPVERVPYDVYKILKAHGFRWTPSLGCFQAYRGNNSTYWADQIANNWKVA